jgi:HAMP domain-containing protein/CheY-like chemotaxis protein/signal transduction histidine kinase
MSSVADEAGGNAAGLPRKGARERGKRGPAEGRPGEPRSVTGASRAAGGRTRSSARAAASGAAPVAKRSRATVAAGADGIGAEGGNGGTGSLGNGGGDGGMGGGADDGAFAETHAGSGTLLRALRQLAAGDFDAHLTEAGDPMWVEIAQAFNSVVETNRNIAIEFSRISRTVGREGRAQDRAHVPGARGSYAAELDSLNSLVVDLTQPTTEVARVLSAVAEGDLSQKMVLEIDGKSVQGEFLRIGTTVNTMVDQLSSFASEVTRVAREVGTEGKLGGQARVPGVGGTWKDLTDNVNFMASNLTDQVRNIALVTTAVANGDLTQKITVNVKGEVLELKETINTMVDQLGSFASEVTRVAREVGTEGNLGGQANVPGVAGTWKDLTDNVNFMASNLTDQVRNIADVTTAVARGDLTRKITAEARGEIRELKNTINTMVDQLSAFASEVTRVAKEVGTEGQLGGQAEVEGVAGTWRDLTENVNQLAGNLTVQLRDVSAVATAIANGDLTRKITAEASGELLQIKEVINSMVDRLSVFADEVTRVAKEVGTEGRLGGQAEVPNVAGTWKDLTDNVNFMATNLTNQVRNIALVTTAVANGDLSQKITVNAQGEMEELKSTINSMVDRLSVFADEVTRVAKEVGTEGQLGGQAQVPNVAGTWKDLTDNVNSMASNLTNQVRNVADVTTAVAKGDLSRKITVDARGEMQELKSTINIMVDQLSAFASEVTRVAKEVGTEGKLGGQAKVEGVAGVWRDLTENVNQLAGNLTVQLRDVSAVATAIANGDMTRKITAEASGELLQIKEVINSMVDRLSVFADEVTRVAKEVGTEGMLGGQAQVPNVAGTWKDLTDNVNFMATNLTDQVRNIADVTTAVAKGDLSRKITVEAKGEVQELKSTINIMVDQLSAFASEVTRVAKEVGTEGKLGGQAKVEGVAGVWRDLTENVNQLAGNLTVQLRDVSAVATAIANGDMTRKITAEASGELLQIKEVINSMVDRLSVFADEVTRVAKEVGTEGMLGGQAQVPNVAGTWKDLTENVNFMATNLTDQVRNIADVTTAVAKGDLSRKITVEAKGEILELKRTINTMVDQLSAFASEVTRVAKEVGTEGQLGGQAKVEGVAGVWRHLTENVNAMAGNLTVQLRDVSAVATAIANGDLTRKITAEASGEIMQIKQVINTMVDRLSVFAVEVTRVAKEVGTEGQLGAQAEVPNVAGTWKNLTDNVNFMAANLTDQVRNIALVTTAVAKGDLTQKITVDVRGEILELKDTINVMVDSLRVFADEVTRVAKEVGTEGRLGGQAEVPGATGTWRALVDNVNQLANNLTVQVRAIGEVATAVTKGDLTRTIAVEARGELDELKGNLNQMIANLKQTTERNEEQDWLKTNLAKFSRMMQGQKDLSTVSQMIMSELTPLVGAHHGAFYIGEQDTDALRLLATYAYKERKNLSNVFKPGEGLVGQAALEKKPIVVSNVPDDYVKISSGLGEAPPRYIIVIPVLFEGEVKAVIELGSFRAFNQNQQVFLDQLAESVGVVINMISASMRTEELLQQSQSLTQELQSQSQELQTQQEELRRTNGELEAQAKSLRASEEQLREQQEELQQVNEELEEKAALLAEQNRKVEQKNREVEQARVDIEDKAEQLAVSSKYKSEFLANMSHELRTPLNSLLILAKQLATNPDGNLTPKQVEFASTIHGAGTDLLSLINDVLDLSKVEAGKMDVHATAVSLDELNDFCERTFRPIADQKGLGWVITRGEDVASTIITDRQRLQQVLKNLLSNAFKFTESGSVSLTITNATGQKFMNPELAKAPSAIAFEVRDTGIGIANDKQRLIFEAFQQADGSTSRKFGGTGLGLSISRELARLLGGEIRVESGAGTGSTFTLILPQTYSPSPDMESRAEPVTQPRRPVDRTQYMPVPRTPSPASEGEPSSEFVTDNPMEDDRHNLQAGDRMLLIIENDPPFARILRDLAREKSYRALVALDGETGLRLAHEYKPDAITLDIDLPGIDGWQVLDRLKHHPDTRHIPVHIVSGVGRKQEGLRAGALSFLEKPVSRESLLETIDQMSGFIDRGVRNLLVVEDDETQRNAIIELIGDDDVNIVAVGTAAEAIEQLRSSQYDCMVLDLGLHDSNGFDLLEQIKTDESMQSVPIIIYTGKDLSSQEETQLRRYADTIIVKDARSPERLLDETALFLHRIEARLPEDKRRMLEQLHNTESVLTGRKVLVVDDDLRNIFALTAVLEANGMDVVFAENGNDAIAKLKENTDTGIVLMDVMMPEKDGYETTREIRQMAEFRTLPIIALTAKAMKGDREKCIAAGASDYVTKPVDTDQLLSLMRVWLYR